MKQLTTIMKQQDLQLVLKFKNDEFISNEIKIRKLSRKGCVNCKRRKVKCDEKKPECQNCSKRSVKCNWQRLCVGGVNDTSRTIEKGERTKETASSLIEGNNEPSSDSSADTYILRNIDSIQNDNTLPSKSAIPSLGFDMHFSNMDVALCESFCYQAFVNGVLCNIGQSYFRVRFSIGEVLPKYWDKNLILKEIFAASGYSFLTFNGTFSNHGYTAYIRSVKSLLKEIKKTSINNIENWTIDATQFLQFFCLKDFFIGDTQIQAINHLNATYNLLDTKIQDIIKSLKATGEERGLEYAYSHILTISPSIRPIIENFLINFSFIMLFCGYKHLKHILINPFEDTNVFNISLKATKSNEDDWFDNEIFIITNCAFKLSAQCTWLLRMEAFSDTNGREVCLRLLNLSEKLLLVLELKKIDFVHDENLKNIYKGCMVLRGCIILLKKMADPSLRATDLKQEIDKVIEDIENPINDDMILPVWVLFIGSVSSVSFEQRNYFRSKLSDVAHRMKSYTLLGILNYVDSIWDSYPYEECFKGLFDGTLLNSNNTLLST